MSLRSLALVLAFLAGLLAVDRSAGLLLGQAFSRLHSEGRVGLANWALEQTDAELVVFGSSRAVYHVDPEILQEELGLSAFNAGAPGQSIRYARAMQALLLARGSRARVFVLHVDPKNLWGVESARLQRLAPFYGEDPAVDALLEASSPMARLKLQSWAYRYNSLVVPIVANLLQDRPTPGNGFRVIPADRPQDLERRAPHTEPGEILPEISQLYVDFIAVAREKGIRVAFVDSPRWRPDGPSSVRPTDRIGHRWLGRLAREHGAAWIVIDDSHESRFAGPQLFADISHLNHEGATLYSQLLAEQLRRVLDAP